MNWDTVVAPMTFPVEHRPIYAVPVANVTHAGLGDALPMLAEAVGNVAEHYRNERILVHCVSYRVAEYLCRAAPAQRRLTYTSAEGRADAIAAYEKQPGAILFTPSMARGYDGADDLARVVVVAKVPYPNLGNPQINARFHAPGGKLWYNVESVRHLVQATGRGVRSAEDCAHTYILDSQFRRNLYRHWKHLFPRWWRDAVTSIPPFNI